jgi:hypothetical protein
MTASGIPDRSGESSGSDGRGDPSDGQDLGAEPGREGPDGQPEETTGVGGAKAGGAAWAADKHGSGADPRDGRVDYLQPLTNELISAVLDARGYQFFTDSDGDIGGRWDDHMIYFFRFGTDGEVLQVRILVGHTFTTADVPKLYAFCNEWNHDRLWPKAYVHVYDDGMVRVCGEVMADLTAGVAFDQLTQLIECGIETGLHMAEAVEELQDA